MKRYKAVNVEDVNDVEFFEGDYDHATFLSMGEKRFAIQHHRLNTQQFNEAMRFGRELSRLDAEPVEKPKPAHFPLSAREMRFAMTTPTQTLAVDVDVDDLIRGWRAEDQEEDNSDARRLLLDRTRSLGPQLRPGRFGCLVSRCLSAAEDGDQRLCAALSLEIDVAEQAIQHGRNGLVY